MRLEETVRSISITILFKVFAVPQNMYLHNVYHILQNNEAFSSKSIIFLNISPVSVKTLGRTYPISSLNDGIIEDLDLSVISHSPIFYPSVPSTLNELSKSIKEKGLLHFITVRAKGRQYEIVA